LHGSGPVVERTTHALTVRRSNVATDNKAGTREGPAFLLIGAAISPLHAVPHRLPHALEARSSHSMHPSHRAALFRRAAT